MAEIHRIPVKVIENGQKIRGILCLDKKGLIFSVGEQVIITRTWDWSNVNWNSGKEPVLLFLFFSKKEFYYEIFSASDDAVKVYVENKYKNKLETTLRLLREEALQASVNKKDEQDLHHVDYMRDESDKLINYSATLNIIDVNLSKKEELLYDYSSVQKDYDEDFRKSVVDLINVLEKIAKQKQAMEHECLKKEAEKNLSDDDDQMQNDGELRVEEKMCKQDPEFKEYINSKICFQGVEYPSEEDMVKAFNVEYSVYKQRLALGWTQEEALGIVSETTSGKKNKLISDTTNDTPTEETTEKYTPETTSETDNSALDEEQDDIVYKNYRKIFQGEYYDKFTNEWTDITKRLLLLKEKNKGKKLHNSKKYIKPQKRTVIVSKKHLFSYPPERKISLSCYFGHKTFPLDQMKNSIAKRNLENSRCHEDYDNNYTLIQISQIQNLLFYLKYATVGEIDIFELTSSIEEVYEWLCNNVGYNKKWNFYSITEYAGEIYDEITSLPSEINKSQTKTISCHIDHLIFRVFKYFDISENERIIHFLDEWSLYEEYESDNSEWNDKRLKFLQSEGTMEETGNTVLEINCSEIETESEQSIMELMVQNGGTAYRPVNQKDIIQLLPFERTIVNAGPGTGQTWTLIEKIKYLLTNSQIPSENILVLCFSRAAVEVVRKRLSEAFEQGDLPITWQMLDVRTFDSFSTYMIVWAQEYVPELLPVHYMLEKEDYEMRIKTAKTILEEYPDMLAEYEHIFVDEVQDLVGSRAELVLALLCSLPETCGFTLFGDSCQALYDYLAENDNSVMTSEEFYRHLIRYFSDANFFSLKKNYRQKNQLAGISIPYRNAILSEKSEVCAETAKALYDAIPLSDIDLKHPSKEKLDKYSVSNTVGILTRTNGQALQISSKLKSMGIRHDFQQAISSKDLAGWIGLVLLRAKSDVIEKNEFIRIFSELYPQKNEEAIFYWYALADTQKGQIKNRYEVEYLLKGLLQNAKNSLLFKEPCNDNNMITVSNIHRAKGREFDIVILLDDVISSMTQGDNNLEHKVCYVAVTRARKKLEKAAWSNQYVYISRDEQRRCFKSRKNYLSEYEIGDSRDFDSRTFGASTVRQRIIKTNLKPGKALKLLKCAEGSETYVVYRLVMETDEFSILGYTSPQFATGIKKAIQRIFHTYKDIPFRYYPDMFVDIYVDDLITCISADGENVSGARQFGSMYLWIGVSASGFAKIKKKNY